MKYLIYILVSIAFVATVVLIFCLYKIISSKILKKLSSYFRKSRHKKNVKIKKSKDNKSTKNTNFIKKRFATIKGISSKTINSIKTNQTSQKIWNTTKKYSKNIQEKAVSASKKSFFALVKISLTFSERAQCPKCKTLNNPVSHIWENIENGFNHVGQPVPNFGKRLNSYNCKKCKHHYTKKLPIKEAICPKCGSIDCMLESDGKKNYIDTNYAKYKNQKVAIGLLKRYTWGLRVIDMHQIFYCKKCDLNMWQFKSESSRDCCPYCHRITEAKKRVYVEDVSTYHKSEVVAHRRVYVDSNTIDHVPIYGEVAYEHGYEVTEYYCPACDTIVHRHGYWYDRKL